MASRKAYRKERLMASRKERLMAPWTMFRFIAIQVLLAFCSARTRDNRRG